MIGLLAELKNHQSGAAPRRLVSGVAHRRDGCGGLIDVRPTAVGEPGFSTPYLSSGRADPPDGSYPEVLEVPGNGQWREFGGTNMFQYSLPAAVGAIR